MDSFMTELRSWRTPISNVSEGSNRTRGEK